MYVAKVMMVHASGYLRNIKRRQYARDLIYSMNCCTQRTLNDDGVHTREAQIQNPAGQRTHGCYFKPLQTSAGSGCHTIVTYITSGQGQYP